MIDQIDEKELILILSAVHSKAFLYYDTYKDMNEISFCWPNGIKPSKEDIDNVFSAYEEYMALYDKLKKLKEL